MAETSNIASIAELISKDIFKHFGWSAHPKRDDNFHCNNEAHLGKGGASKLTHPADVLFYYDDAYLGKRIYLHTDLKSYATDTITSTKLRDAFKSLCMTVECAKDSQEWREKYSVGTDELHEVRGFLFVHNHDNGYIKPFSAAIDKISLQNLPIAPGCILHFFGPQDIQRLYSVANDIMRLKAEKELPSDYTFYYPDMILNQRRGDIWSQSATIESLTGSYVIIRYKFSEHSESGYFIYYNRPCSSADEMVYFLDTLSRFQMLESGVSINIRITDPDAAADFKSIFKTAKNKYSKACGFDPTREEVLDAIKLERITNMTSTYSPGEIGWRES